MRTLKMDATCRTCLRSSGTLLPLFEDARILHKIKIISSVEVYEDDNLPKNVCGECMVNINLSYNFRRVIISSDLQLREFLVSLCDKQADINNDTMEQNNSADVDEIVKCEDISEELHSLEDNVVQNQQNLISVVKVENELTSESTDERIKTNKDDSHVISIGNGKKLKLDNEKDKIVAFAMKLKQKKSSEQKLYECSKCDFKTTDKKKLAVHRPNHNIQICSICGKFITAINMNKHLLIHTDSPVSCEYCGKVFKNPGSLRGHLLLHKGINRTCKTCGKSYTQPSAYRHHLKSHKSKEETLVKCSFCDKRLDKSWLSKHIRKHTGERPYQCDFCKKGFSSSNALKTHRRQHTKERPYTCALCFMGFPQRVSLRTHLRSKHQMKNIDGT